MVFRVLIFLWNDSFASFKSPGANFTLVSIFCLSITSMCHLSDLGLNGLRAVENEILTRHENTGTLQNDPNWEDWLGATD